MTAALLAPPASGFVADRLAVRDPEAWIPATDLVSGDRLESLFAIPRRLWSAAPHAAAVLAWKTYTYRLAQPLALAWSTAREVPLLSADNVLVQISSQRPYVTVGLRRSTSAVLSTSSAVRSHDAIVAPDEAGLLDFLRLTLMEQHLRPLLARTRLIRRVGERVLWGQVAAGVAYALSDVSSTPGEDAMVLTEALGLRGLAGVGEDDQVWRNTCCLAFSTPSLDACRDCCMHERAGGRGKECDTGDR
jgi:ferric iron reductase protein FhuF